MSWYFPTVFLSILQLPLSFRVCGGEARSRMTGKVAAAAGTAPNTSANSQHGIGLEPVLSHSIPTEWLSYFSI
jgi:hypothetical protein